MDILYLDKEKTINHQTYYKDCLKPLISSLKGQRTTCGTKNLKFHHDNAQSHVYECLKNDVESKNFIMHHPPYSSLLVVFFELIHLKVPIYIIRFI